MTSIDEIVRELRALYTSRYGGNDPDVWPTDECPVCEGTGYALYETEEIEEEEIMADGTSHQT